MDCDALLFLSFGGPEKPEDVRPFLDNVTRGRAVPSARLDEVAQHYFHFGGRSPINALNRAIIDAVKAELARQGIALPIYFGNRNWHPLIEDTVATMAADGINRALVFTTSAYGGYSASQQYQEDIDRARAAVGPAAPELIKIGQYFDHPLFIASNVEAVRRAYLQLPADGRHQARLVFTAHSVPIADAHPYAQHVAEAAHLVATAIGIDDYDVVWQSRSGPPHVPWLEPDILDHVSSLHARGTCALVISPIGFTSDHIEVLWDLDVEAQGRAQELGMTLVRAGTPGADPRFAEMIVKLVHDHLA